MVMFLDRKAVMQLFIEVHYLYLEKDMKSNAHIKGMTEAQFDNIWAVVDEDKSGFVTND
jgi:hypothetical protein